MPKNKFRYIYFMSFMDLNWNGFAIIKYSYRLLAEVDSYHRHFLVSLIVV